MAGSDKTEKATPKRREDARKKGQVARSADINGAVVMLAGILAIGAFGPAFAERMENLMRSMIALGATPEVVGNGGLGSILRPMLESAAFSVLPIMLACVAAGVVASVAQVRWRVTPQALKPDLRKLDPIKGAKNLFGPNALVETGKSIVKVSVVGAIVFLAVAPQLPEFAAQVGMAPGALASRLLEITIDVAQRAAIAYLVIGAFDYFWQRHRHEKSLKMDKQEVKDEYKEQSLPAHVRSEIRRKQMQAARARMMAAVPTADVVVTNPTHYAVALAYDGTREAPEVVAKGKDLMAARIKELAAEHEVPVVSDPPLARTLHANVEVGRQIPEDLYRAVAELLAFVYRMAGRKAVAA